MTKLTLQQIRDHSPCREGWTRLLRTLDTDDMTTVVSIGQIARSNGPDDALWCLRCADFDRSDVVRVILPAVKRAFVHNSDKRVADCISVIEAWLEGNATEDDLRAAADAARAAAYAAYAADAARAAADAAAYAAYAAADAADAAYAAYAAYAADAARAAAYAAYAAADAAADAAEREQQIEDICKVFP